MVYKVNKKTLVFLFILFPLFSFAFDANSTHPALTEEIVKYYNSFAERKITNEELELLKQGSIFEDKSPRWVNHFYDFFNNSAINWSTLRGVSEIAIKLFLKTLPHKPLKSIDWSQNELAQLKYLDNRVYQKAKRLYFENKREAFLTLGYILHLLEDLGVPEHARGDAHAGVGFIGDPKSNYEDYAKSITDKYNLKFAEELIKNKTQPYKFNDINSIFTSLAKFTASNWFSEDTINLFSLPKITHYQKIEDNKVLAFNNSNVPIALKFYDFKNRQYIYTTDNDLIHQHWFNSVVPEILKHGVALLDLYFLEVKDMEKEEAIKLHEEYKGLTTSLINFVSFFDNIPSYISTITWQTGEKILNATISFANTIKSIFNPEIQVAKSDYTPQIAEKSYQEDKTIDQEKQQEQSESEFTYQERINAFIEENKNQDIIQLSNTNVKTEKISSSTQTLDKENVKGLDNEDEDENENENEEAEENQPLFMGGSNITKKDPCDDYKNKSYPNILISEIQFETEEDTKDEFIELYNPTDKEIDLTCWSLEKYAAKDPSSQNPPSLTILIPQSKFEGVIKPFSFFLITSSSTKEKYKGDLSYAESYSIAKNNSIILRKPNGEISDVVGYGDNQEKIYQFEKSPFLAKDFKNKSIQRKNLQDSDNNSEDFWLHNPNPENSNATLRKPREDFVDLTKIQIKNFQIEVTQTDEEVVLNISYEEPQLNIASDNYSYKILISTSSNDWPFKLEDFGISITLPKPKFDGSTTLIQFSPNKCPTNFNSYYFGLIIEDILDSENKSQISIAPTTLFEDFCSFQEEQEGKLGKILISEIYVKEGTSTNEYIELYNPNDFEISLNGWNLIIEKEGKEEYMFSTSTRAKYKLKGAIKPFGFYLIANANNNLKETFSIEPDTTYSKSKDIAKNNRIKLINPKIEVVDLVEIPVFNKELILIRKAGINSTKESVLNEEKEFGHGYYNDEHKDEFLIIDIPEPQNSNSTQEIPPEFLTKFDYSLEEQNLIITFNSPYRSSLSAKYLIKDTSTNEVLNIQLPEVKPFAEPASIKINICENKLNKFDSLAFILKINEEEKYIYPLPKINENCYIYKSEGYVKFSWGKNSPYTVKAIAQELKVEKIVKIKKVSLKISKINESLGDKVYVEIQNYGKGKPDTGELISKSKEVDEISIPKSFDPVEWINFEFDKEVELLPGSYFFVFKRYNWSEENFYFSLKDTDRKDDGNKFWYFIGSEGGWKYNYRIIDNTKLVETLAIIIE